MNHLRFAFALLCLLAFTVVSYAQKGDETQRDLEEIVVKPKHERYRRKGNPAVELMRKVIAAKANHRIEDNEFVRYQRYQRLTFALNNISQQLVDSMPILQQPLLRRQVEFCPQTGKYILPFSYSETVNEHLYRKRPRKERDYVLGTNSEGLTELFVQGDMFNTVLKSIFTDINVYDDVITLLERKFTSPLSRRAAISFFQFFIMDTVSVENQRVIRLNFVPQNPQDFGFSGWLYVIDDGSYRVQQCTLHLPVRSSVNYVNALTLQQRFTDLPTGQRVLLTDDLFAELGIVKGHRAFMIHRATNYTDFSLDSIASERFKASDALREGTTDTKDSTFWASHRFGSLTRGEQALTTLNQELYKVRGFGWGMLILKTFVENHIETSMPPRKNYFDIGPVNTFISKNFIDGLRLRFGGQTTAHLHPHLFFKGYLAYGTNSRQLYGLAQLEWSFLRKKYSAGEYPRHSLLAEWQQDVMSPGDLLWQNGRDKDNVFVAFKAFQTDHMMRNRRFTFRWELETNNHLDLKLQVRSSQLTPCGALFYQRLDGSMMKHFNMTELTASMRWAPGEEVVNTKQRRHVVNHNNPVFALSHTWGPRGMFGNEVESHLTEATIYKRFWLYSYGRIDLELRGGAQWNAVPFPLLILPTANHSYIITRGMFNMIAPMEFINDRYASLSAEWDLSGKLFNRIPLLKQLKWREVIGFRTIYGHLTDKNNPDLHPGSRDLLFFPQRDGQSIEHRLGRQPYMEMSLGVHNIFKVIRVDYVRRINYLNYPGVKKHGVRLCLDIHF